MEPEEPRAQARSPGPNGSGSGAPGPSGVQRQSLCPPEATLLIEEVCWHRYVRGVGGVVARAARAAGGAATVVLSNDREVKRLNWRFRGRNKPTNVLTFPDGGGDIILALGTVRREAAASGRSTAQHLAHLVVHGALHLRGHDHHAPGDARRMEMAEARILRRLNVPNPWKRR